MREYRRAANQVHIAHYPDNRALHAIEHDSPPDRIGAAKITTDRFIVHDSNAFGGCLVPVVDDPAVQR